MSLNIFHKIYFDHYLSPFATPPRSFLDSLPIQLYNFSLTNKPSVPPHKETWSMACVGKLLLSIRSALEWGQYTHCHSIKTLDLPSPWSYQLWISSWISMGLFSHFLSSILPGLSLYMSCSCWHILCDFFF